MKRGAGIVLVQPGSCCRCIWIRRGSRGQWSSDGPASQLPGGDSLGGKVDVYSST